MGCPCAEADELLAANDGNTMPSNLTEKNGLTDKTMQGNRRVQVSGTFYFGLDLFLFLV